MGRAATRRSSQNSGTVLGAAVGVFGLMVLLAFPVAGFALTCTDIGGTPAGPDCTLSTVFVCTVPTTVSIPGNFTITGTGGINCSGTTGPAGNPGGPGTPGKDLTVNVGKNFSIDDNGFLASDGGAGGPGLSGAPGGNGGPGGSGGNITVNVTAGDMTLAGDISAQGGPDGPGGAGNINRDGGTSSTSGASGNVSITVSGNGKFTESSTGGIAAVGGAGGAGGPGGAGAGRGRNGAVGENGGNIGILSCQTTINGLLDASGAAGGSGGTGGNPAGAGGSNGSGGNAGTITLTSGANLILGATAVLGAVGGNEGAVGAGHPPGVDAGVGGNGGLIVGVHCNTASLLNGGAGVFVNGGFNGGTPGLANLNTTSNFCCGVVAQKKDATLLHSAKNLNNGANLSLRVGTQIATVLGFDVCATHTNAQLAAITSATLTLTTCFTPAFADFCPDPSSQWPVGGGNIFSYRLKDGFEDWTEGNGNNFPILNNPHGTGDGTTWNCTTDTNIANETRDCPAADYWNAGLSLDGPPRGPSVPLITNNIADGTQVTFDVTQDVKMGCGPLDKTFMTFFVRKPQGGGFVSFYSREGAVDPRVANPAFAPQLTIVP